jgi:hypothetical protein
MSKNIIFIALAAFVLGGVFGLIVSSEASKQKGRGSASVAEPVQSDPTSTDVYQRR